MTNDYICHGDHKYLAKIKLVGNAYRYFYTQKAYDAYKKAGKLARATKALGSGVLAVAKSSYDRKKLATTSRRTDVFDKWDEARRKEYETNAINATGPGAGQHTLNTWNQMISDFGKTLWKKDGDVLVQVTVPTSESIRKKPTYAIRPKSRKKNVTGNAKPGSTAKR